MESIHLLDQQAEQILRRIECPAMSEGDFDTCVVVYELASTQKWGEAEFERVDFISKRIDISNKLFSAYFENGRKAVDADITDSIILELVILILLRAVLIGHVSDPVGLRLKRFNTLFKALDLMQPEWLLPETELGIEMESRWESTLSVLEKPAENLEIISPLDLTTGSERTVKTIPLTVLFYEGPIARAYLATIRALGLRPQKIIELVAGRDIATKKTVGKWMPKGLRLSYASSIQRTKIHYWPKQIIKNNTDFSHTVLGVVQKKYGFDKTVITNAHALMPLTDYCDCVESILIEGLGDKKLQQVLLKEPAGTVLYTGGGILPGTLLELQHLKFLHIHPGFLPDFRGADCALWSTLLTGHTSASCFYMSKGIDTGDIISTCWLPRLIIDQNIKSMDLKTIYRAVYGFIDPWIRAYVLRRVINDNSQYYELISTPQYEAAGITYYFMNKRLQEAALQKFFHSA